MRSIRLQLFVWLVAGALALMAAAGVGLYAYMEQVLERGLDGALAAKADAIAGAVHTEDDGQPHLLLDGAAASAAIGDEGLFYFQIWRADGRTLAGMAPPVMRGASLPKPQNLDRRFYDARLVDGSTSRATRLTFGALPDEDEYDSGHIPMARRPEMLDLVVLHDRRSIDRSLRVLLTGLLLAAAFTAAGILAIVSWGVRRGLRPLADVSALAAAFGPESLDVRFPGPSKLPAELAPIATKLNELLDRLSAAFARERRFSAAVAHELRTPLAELRTACDVALRWPDDTAGLSIALQEARDVAVQMSTMVQTLLALARQQSAADLPPASAPIQLCDAVNSAVEKATAAAAARRLEFVCDVDRAAIVPSNAALLAAVLRNVLDNAVTYALPAGEIRIRAVGRPETRWTLSIANSTDMLTPADVPRLFEPFWRADSGRTGGGANVGLGLTLVKAYCDAMGIAVHISMTGSNTVEISLSFPALSQETLSAAKPGLLAAALSDAVR